jgi:hypothetical protein
MDDGRYVRDAILDRMIQPSDSGLGGPQAATFGTHHECRLAR